MEANEIASGWKNSFSRKHITKECCSKSLWVAMAAEFLGTAFLLFTYCVAFTAWDGVKPPLIVQMLVGGFALGYLVDVFFHMSGGHLNPALTIGFLLVGQITLFRAPLYILAQILGSIAGSGIAWVLVPDRHHGSFATTVPHPEVTTGEAVAWEAIFTGTLMLCLMATGDKRLRGANLLGVPISMVVAVAVAMGHRVTGPSLNPVRSFGPAVYAGQWSYHWVYWVGPILGAAIVALLYQFGLAWPLLAEQRELSTTDHGFEAPIIITKERNGRVDTITRRTDPNMHPCNCKRTKPVDEPIITPVYHNNHCNCANRTKPVDHENGAYPRVTYTHKCKDGNSYVKAAPRSNCSNPTYDSRLSSGYSVYVK